MMTFTVILIPSITFFMLNSFPKPFIGSIFFKSGVSGLVVKIKPNCITAAIIPESATIEATGTIIKTNSRKETKPISKTMFFVKGVPTKEM